MAKTFFEFYKIARRLKYWNLCHTGLEKCVFLTENNRSTERATLSEDNIFAKEKHSVEDVPQHKKTKRVVLF